MSTTLGIIPVTINERLTFGSVIELAEKTISDFLQENEMNLKVQVLADIHNINEKYVNTVDMDSPYTWNENEYAYFKIARAKTGVDCYIDKISDTLEYWETYVEDNTAGLVTVQQIKTIKKVNIKWYFRRSAGQAALINIVYGHLAAALAELTEGIITADKGWEPENFPVKASGFRSVYFRPEKTVNESKKKLIEKSLNHLRESAAVKNTKGIQVL